MDEYIKRDKAIDELRRRKALFCKNQIEFKLLPTNDKSRVDEIDACIAMLINMPPEDVQPVVRCSECEHWNEGICCCDDYEIHCQDYYVGDMHTEPDFFCGFGKRKGVDE